jgi:hypothetical protein
VAEITCQRHGRPIAYRSRLAIISFATVMARNFLPDAQNIGQERKIT